MASQMPSLEQADKCFRTLTEQWGFTLTWVCWLTASLAFSPKPSWGHGWLHHAGTWEYRSWVPLCLLEMLGMCQRACWVHWTCPDHDGSEIQQHTEQFYVFGNQQCTSWIVPVCWALISCCEEKSIQVSRTQDFSQDISLLTSTSHFCKPQLQWMWPECETDAIVQKPGLPDTSKIVSSVCAVFQETGRPFGSCPEESRENNARKDQRHWGFFVLKREAQDISIAFKGLKGCFGSESNSPWTLKTGEEVLV